MEQTLTVLTRDNWRLRLRRSTGRGFPVPVLLLHGFGANTFVLGNGSGSSLASYLVEHGHDVFCLDFRGTQTSVSPDGDGLAAVDVDAKIQRDLPAAIDCVLRESGASQLDVAGFSLGGTILYAYLAHYGEEKVRRCVTIGSPLRFRFPAAAKLLRSLCTVEALRRALPQRLPMRGFCQLGAVTHIEFPARPHFNLANMARPVLYDMMRTGTEDASLSELLQIMHWSKHGRVVSRDGAIDYLTRFPQVSTPLLLIGGTADRHVDPADLLEVLRIVRSREKALRLIGKDHGARRDYGHTDLLLGVRVAEEVFPHVQEWFAQRWTA